MESAGVTLPPLHHLNVSELKALLLAQHAELISKDAELLSKDEELLLQRAELLSYKTEIESMKLLILKLRRMQFGRKSEKRARQIEQLELWVEDLCETLELEPVRFKVIRTVRPKLACACCDTIVQEPAQSRPIERGIAGPALLAHVLVGKYGDHRVPRMYERR